MSAIQIHLARVPRLRLHAWPTVTLEIAGGARTFTRPCVHRLLPRQILPVRATGSRPFSRPFSTVKPSLKNTAPGLDASVSGGKAVPPGSSPPPTGQYAYPARLVIYHAGTGRTVFLGWLKIATIFTFALFGLVVSPKYWDGDEPLWAAAYFAGGMIPFIFVAWTTAPFVTFVYIHLPPFARTSRAMLQRFVKAPPPSTRIDLSTLSLIGKPRVSSTTVGELRPTRRRLGTVNYERDTAAESAQRKWWQFRAVGKFNIQPGMESRLKTGWVWKDLAESIARRTQS